MALRYDPRLYTGGAVEVDSTPSVNMYGQLLAKKQAKDEALNQFFEKELSSLSPTGVREKHKPDIVQGIDALKRQWVQNKDRIMKDPNSRIEFDRAFNELAYKIDRAKARDKKVFEIGKLMTEGKLKKDWRNIQMLDKLSGSIFDPSSYKEDGVSEYELTDFYPAAEKFDADRQIKFWKGITEGIKPGKKYDYSKQYVNKSTGQVVVPFVEEFEDKQIEGIAENARKFAESDPSANEYYQDLIDNPTRENFDRLQKAYSKYFQGMVDTPGKAAAADAILRASIKEESSEEQEKQSKPTVIKNYMGGGSSSAPKEIGLREIYDDVVRIANESGYKVPLLPGKVVPLDRYNATQMEILLSKANKLLRESKDEELFQQDVFVHLLPDNKIELVRADNMGRKAKLEYADIDYSAQPSVKEKRAVAEEQKRRNNQGNTKPKPEVKETRQFVFPNGKTKF